MKNIKLYCDNKIFKYDGYTLRKGIKSFEQNNSLYSEQLFTKLTIHFKNTYAKLKS